MEHETESIDEFFMALVFFLLVFVCIPLGFGWSIHAWGGDMVTSMIGSFVVLGGVVIVLIEHSS